MNTYWRYSMDFFNYDVPEPQRTDSIPHLTTKQTAGMRDRYPKIEHLEAGNVGSWLQERRDQLWESARSIEIEVDSAKVITLAVAATGLVLNAVNPFALAGGAIAGAAYLWTLVQDYHQTKNFAPLPLVRGNFFEFLSAMGDSDARGNYLVDHELETLKFLEARSRMEYAMLHDKFDTVAQYLIQVQTGKRFHAYRWVQQVFTRYKTMPSVEAMRDHLKDIEPDTRINVRQVTAIQQERPQFVVNQEPKTIGSMFVGKHEKTIGSEELFGKKPEQKKIGSETKLNALDTLAVPSKAAVDYYDPMARAKIDIINEMSLRISNTLIIGIPGSGKGMLVANAIRTAKQKHSRIKIFVIEYFYDIERESAA